METIPLVRVRYANSFVQMMNDLGAPSERVLNKAGLSEEVLAVPDGFIPVRQLWQFTALAAQCTGVPDIGLMSGLTPLGEHSQFGHNVIHSPTLYQAISRFCNQARVELTDAAFCLRQQEGMAWFGGGAVEGTDDEIRQVELYRIGMMIQVIRAFLRDDWQPRHLQLQSCNERSLRDTDLIRNANVRFGCDMGSVGFPRHALSLTLRHGDGQRSAAPFDPGMAIAPADKLTLDHALKEIIRTHIRSHQGGIQRVARSLDVPVRTLQRRLAEKGLIFSNLVEEARIETARQMLENTDAKIIEIAMETGYTEPTHFTRAFRRVTGVTPQQYRASHNSAKQ